MDSPKAFAAQKILTVAGRILMSIEVHERVHLGEGDPAFRDIYDSRCLLGWKTAVLNPLVDGPVSYPHCSRESRDGFHPRLFVWWTGFNQDRVERTQVLIFPTIRHS